MDRVLVAVTVVVVCLAVGTMVTVAYHRYCSEGGDTDGQIEASPVASARGAPRAAAPEVAEHAPDVLPLAEDEQQTRVAPPVRGPARVAGRLPLPSMERVQQMSRSRDRALRLSPEQREKLKEVGDLMRRKAEEAMAENWAEQNRLKGRTGGSDAADADGRLAELVKKEDEVRHDLDRQCRTLLGAFLSPTQMSMLGHDLTPTQQALLSDGGEPAHAEASPHD